MATTLGTVARSNLGKHRLRFALTSIGIAISAFFLSAVLISNLSLMTTVKQSAATLYGDADLVVEDPGHTEYGLVSLPYLSKDAVQTVQDSPDVKASWGIAATNDALRFETQTNQQMTDIVTRVDLPADDSVLSLPLTAGNLPTDSKQVLVSSVLAQQHGLQVGQKVIMDDYTGFDAKNSGGSMPTTDFTISGIYTQDTAMGNMSNMVFTGGSLTADYNRVASSIDEESPQTSGYNLLLIKLAPGVSDEDFRNELAATGVSAVISTVDQKIEKDAESFTGGLSELTAIILGFGLLALLMSSFVIANTYRVYAASRTRELALLRTLGATRFALVRMLLLEAFMLGVLSALAGVATAYGLAFLATLSVNGFYVISFSPLPAVVALIVCGVVALLSALAPAWSMRNISPIAAIHAVPETRTSSLPKKIWFWGATLILPVLTGAGIYWGHGDSLSPGYVLATVALATFLVLIFPFFLYPLLTLLAKFTQPFTPAGMAHSNIRQARSQTVATGRMLFICAAFLAALLTGYNTVKVSALALTEELSPFPVTGQVTVTDWEQKTHIEDEVKNVEGVSSVVVAVPQGSLEYAQGSLQVYSVDPARLEKIAPKILPESLSDQELLVDRGTAESMGLSEGNTVSVKGTGGSTVNLTVQLTDANIYFPIITATTGQELSGQQIMVTGQNSYQDAYLMAGFAEGFSFKQRIDALPQISAAASLAVDQLSGHVPVSQQIEVVLTIALYVALGLLGATLVITLIGIANTQILSAYQRRRPYALLRVAGMSKKQLRSMISYETTQVALVSLVLGIGAGYGCAVLLLQIYATNGFTLNYSVQGWDLLLVLIGGLLLTWLTSLIPALRASRLSPVVSLQETH